MFCSYWSVPCVSVGVLWANEHAGAREWEIKWENESAKCTDHVHRLCNFFVVFVRPKLMNYIKSLLLFLSDLICPRCHRTFPTRCGWKTQPLVAHYWNGSLQPLSTNSAVSFFFFIFHSFLDLWDSFDLYRTRVLTFGQVVFVSHHSHSENSTSSSISLCLLKLRPWNTEGEKGHQAKQEWILKNCF